MQATRTTYLEAKSRPRFRESLDLKEHALLEITDSYQEPERVPCGLSSCRTPHNKGYIVETSDGLQTNIGHVCGRVHLGANFRVLENQFRARQREHDHFATIDEFLRQAAAHVARIDALWHGKRGGAWLAECHEALEALPSRVRTRLRDAQRQGDGRIFRIEQSQDEEDDVTFLSRLGLRSDGRSIREEIGRLTGLEAARPTALLALKAELIDRIHKYAAASPQRMKPAERRSWSSFCATIDEQVQRLERLLEQGRRFFSDSNFTELEKLADTRDERHGVRRVWERIARLAAKRQITTAQAG